MLHSHETAFEIPPPAEDADSALELFASENTSEAGANPAVRRPVPSKVALDPKLRGPQAVVTSPGRSPSIVWWLLSVPVAWFLVGWFVGSVSSPRWTGGIPAFLSGLATGSSEAKTPAESPRPLIAPPAAAVESPNAMTRPLAKGSNEAKASAPSQASVGPLAGTLSIDSHPGGAKVFIDEQLVGTTPMLLPAISPGTHVVRLQLDGYHGWSSTAQVDPNRRNRVAGSLEEIGHVPGA